MSHKSRKHSLKKPLSPSKIKFYSQIAERIFSKRKKYESISVPDWDW